MNAAERLVEIYYRQKNCFIISDIKIIGGINRQIDLLVFDPNSMLYYHVESSVGHGIHFAPNLAQVYYKIKYNFFGALNDLPPSDPKNKDTNEKTFLKEINRTYESFGINPTNLIRVWCTWCFDKFDKDDLEDWKKRMAEEFRLTPANFEVLSFRDNVMPTLLKETGSSNYDDDLLRCISLVIQYQNQTEKNKVKEAAQTTNRTSE